MRTLFASITVLFTILSAVAFGIACGYAVIIAILRAFGHRSRQQGATAPATAVMATTVTGNLAAN